MSVNTVIVFVVRLCTRTETRHTSHIVKCRALDLVPHDLLP